MPFLAPLIFRHRAHVEAIISLSTAITWNRMPWARLIKNADFIFYVPRGIYSFASSLPQSHVYLIRSVLPKVFRDTPEVDLLTV